MGQACAPTKGFSMAAANRKVSLASLTVPSLLMAALFLSIAASLFFGAVEVEHGQVVEALKAWLSDIPLGDSSAYSIIIEIRMPRALLVAITGAALSLVGVLLQAVTRNPLAEPYYSVKRLIVNGPSRGQEKLGYNPNYTHPNIKQKSCQFSLNR